MALEGIYFNLSDNDLDLDTSGVDWRKWSSGNDRMIFSNGSDAVADGEPIPSQQELISAGVQLDGTEIIVPKYFMIDTSETEIKEIPLMGNVDGRYVWAFNFDDVTASEPTLEFYDDTDFDTFDNVILGEGVASQSFINGITTTDATPGEDWVGDTLAGSGFGYFLYLNGQNGALETAKTLYANLKVIIPASQTTGFGANFVWVCKWLANE